jgi:hypothetical protein
MTKDESRRQIVLSMGKHISADWIPLDTWQLWQVGSVAQLAAENDLQLP